MTKKAWPGPLLCANQKITRFPWAVLWKQLLWRGDDWAENRNLGGTKRTFVARFNLPPAAGPN
jgi:hypothetical protein